MYIHALPINLYSPISSPFLIQLILYDCCNLPKIVFKMWTMYTRSVHRVIQLDEWMHPIWQSSCIQVQYACWLLLQWLLWHHWLRCRLWMSSVIWILLSDLSVTGSTLPSLLAIYQLDLQSRSNTWPVRPLHMHRRITMSHNLVTASAKCIMVGKL